MQYKGYTIETKKYKTYDIYYGHIRELGKDTITVDSRYQAIKETKELIDKIEYPQKYYEKDGWLEERYENQQFAGDDL